LCGSCPPRPRFQPACETCRPGQVAGNRLAGLSAAGGPGGSNGETLLELLASFFSLYDGLLQSGWAAAKGQDADAMRGCEGVGCTCKGWASLPCLICDHLAQCHTRSYGLNAGFPGLMF
jgi:hypothetical protein